MEAFLKTFNQLVDVLGLPFKEKDELHDEVIEQLIEERQDARKNKDFARSDEIRDTLKSKEFYWRIQHKGFGGNGHE